MKIYNEIVTKFNDNTSEWETISEDSFEYSGDVNLAADEPQYCCECDGYLQWYPVTCPPDCFSVPFEECNGGGPGGGNGDGEDSGGPVCEACGVWPNCYSENTVTCYSMTGSGVQTFTGCNQTCPDGWDTSSDLGCTDPSANNYNPNADTDDGSCLYNGDADPQMYKCVSGTCLPNDQGPYQNLPMCQEACEGGNGEGGDMGWDCTSSGTCINVPGGQYPSPGLCNDMCIPDTPDTETLPPQTSHSHVHRHPHRGHNITEAGRNTNRRNQMRKTAPRKMARGGRVRPVPRKMARGGRARPVRGRGRKMPGGGTTCGGMNQPPCPGGGGGYRRGGRTRPAPRGRGRKMARGGRAVRRMPHGGQTHGQAFCPAGTYRTADGLCTPMGS